MPARVPLSSARIRVDPSIPGAVSAFGSLGSVDIFDPTLARDRPDSLADAEVLVFRSDLRIDSDLLGAMPGIRVLATPVIGLDHVDLASLELLQRDGRVPPALVHAPGALAPGVADFALCGILARFPDFQPGQRPPLVGIAGFGNCGMHLARRLDLLGIPWVAHDPPREAREPSVFKGVPFEAICRCDVVSLHLPLTRPGESPWPTAGMVDDGVLHRMLRGGVGLLINTSRGAIIDEVALGRSLGRGSGGFDAFLDVFQNEPAPDPAIVDACLFATPHVAGSVREGRTRALAMVLEGTARHLGIDAGTLTNVISSTTGNDASLGPIPAAGLGPPAIRNAVGMEAVSRCFKANYVAAPLGDRPGVFMEHRLAAMRSELSWDISRAMAD